MKSVNDAVGRAIRADFADVHEIEPGLWLVGRSPFVFRVAVAEDGRSAEVATMTAFIPARTFTRLGAPATLAVPVANYIQREIRALVAIYDGHAGAADPWAEIARRVDVLSGREVTP